MGNEGRPGAEGGRTHVPRDFGCNGGSSKHNQEGVFPLSEEAQLLKRLLIATHSLRNCLRSGGITFGKITKTLEDADDIIKETETYLGKIL